MRQNPDSGPRDHGWPSGAETIVVMQDGKCAFQTLTLGDFDIWWWAYAGMTQKIRISGPLAQTAPEILQTRANARARHGWIMDIYLLRRRANR